MILNENSVLILTKGNKNSENTNTIFSKNVNFLCRVDNYLNK